MNKNTLLAFVLILATVSFFSSRFYYENILKRPHPSSLREQRTRPAQREKQEQKLEKATDASSRTSEILPSTPADDGKEKAAAEEILPEIFDTIWVRTGYLRIGLTEAGARIISVQTEKYREDPAAEKKGRGSPYVELVSDPEAGGGNLKINEQSYDGKLFVLEGETRDFSIEKGKKELSFIWTSPGGDVIRKTYTFNAGEYTAGLRITSDLLAGKRVGVGWLAGITEIEDRGGKGAQQEVRRVHLFDGRNISHITEKKVSRSEESGFYQWTGISSKYFLIALISDSSRDADVTIEAFEAGLENSGSRAKKQPGIINYRIMSNRFVSGTSEEYTLYLGPSSLLELKRLDISLEKVLFRGWKWFFRADVWFPALCEFVLWLLIVLQKGLKDYGLVIIVLTILSRLITYPLTQSSMKSMNRMRELQPKVTAIREKHKSNPQKMNQKMMELYKKEGVNPLNPGCLPMFLQMPVFISLFIVLRKAIELRGAGTWLIPWVHDLSKPEVLPIPGISPLPFEIPLYGSNIALMPVIMAVLTYFQNKATIKDPNQKAMIYFMPVFMLVLFNSFPAGLVLYWTFSSALGLVQQFATEKMKRDSERAKQAG